MGPFFLFYFPSNAQKKRKEKKEKFLFEYSFDQFHISLVFSSTYPYTALTFSEVLRLAFVSSHLSSFHSPLFSFQYI